MVMTNAIGLNLTVLAILLDVMHLWEMTGHYGLVVYLEHQVCGISRCASVVCQHFCYMIELYLNSFKEVFAV